MNEKIEVPTMKVPPLKKICMTIGQLPASYIESMSYYEMLVWFVNYLRDDIIPVVNANGEATRELQELFVQLQEYVNNYFDNLDVQEEINNKLDEMVEEGTLQEIIADYLNSKAIFGFDNVADMKQATNLIDGSYAETLGYYSKNDGGKGLYKITNENLTPDDGSIIELDSGLYAVLIINDDTINTKQFGGYGDGIHNETTTIQKVLDFVKTRKSGKIIVDGNYLIDPSLELRGTNSNKLSNITITGKYEGARSYENIESLKDGFTFIYENFSTSITKAFNIEYIDGLVIDSIFVTSTESVSNGDIPFNLFQGIFIQYCGNAKIKNCNFTKLFNGFATYGSGILNISENNFALCNVGMWLQENGDSTFNDNRFNTNGWNIRNDDGTFLEKYSTLSSINKIYGLAIWAGSCGNTNITSGKIEWNDGGIWLEDCYGWNVSNINFDYNGRFDIGLTTNKKTIGYDANCSITGNRFIASGRYATSSYVSGANIALWKTHQVSINGNTFEAGAGTHYNQFVGSSVNYGPHEGYIRTQSCSELSVVGNTFGNSKKPIVGSFATVNYAGNSEIVTPYTNAIIFKNNRVIRLGGNNQPSYVYGSFDIGDKLEKLENSNSGWLCSASGTATTFNNTCDVIENEITIGNGKIVGGNIAIELKGTINQYMHCGDYINIAGVTGTKKIIDIISLLDGNTRRYFCLLDSACDAVVTGASLTNHTPTFSAFTIS